MNILRHLLICVAATAAVLSSVQAARAQTATFAGKLFYNDCATPINNSNNGDYVTVRVYAADNVTPLSPATKCTTSYLISVTTTGASRNVYINFYFNNDGTGAPDRVLQGIDGNDAKPQNIDVGMSAAPSTPVAPGSPVTISGRLYQAIGGITALTPTQLMGTTISVTDTAPTPNVIPIIPGIGLQTGKTLSSWTGPPFNYQFTLANVPTIADKTVVITYVIQLTGGGTQTWKVKGVVSSGGLQVIDICQ